VDGAVDVALDLGRISLFAEGRGFSDQFGSGEAGAAGAVGGAFRLTQYLGLTGDVGKVLSEDSIPAASASVWALPAR
jgi:hypothetical protein